MLLIAPESEGILARLTARLERAGTAILGCRSAGVAVSADKWKCHGLFTQAGLPTPETRPVRLEDAADAASEMGFPLVVKPIDGAGCEGVSLASGVDSLRSALAQPALQDAGLLLQRYVAGIHASVSLLIAGGESLAVSLNEQKVKIGIPFYYRGGIAGIAHERREEALDLARLAVALVPGLQGYVGVDLVMTDQGCHLIEINPRLTTS